MSCAKNCRSRGWGTADALRTFACLALVVAVGCTVIPKRLESRAASFDGGQQNSGLVAQLADRSAIITTHARDRYNGLIEIYGRKFSPPLQRDAGVTAYTNGTWCIDAEHLVKFATMNRWRKQSTAGP